MVDIFNDANMGRIVGLLTTLETLGKIFQANQMIGNHRP